MLERREVLGGACVTEEIWPGLQGLDRRLRQQPAPAGDHPRARAHRHGFEMLPRSPSSFTPFPDGRSLLLGPGQGAHAPRDLEVLRQGRRGAAEVRGDARAGRRLPRADADHDAAESLVVPAGEPGGSSPSSGSPSSSSAPTGRRPSRSSPAPRRPSSTAGSRASSSRSRSRPTPSSARWRRPPCRARRTCCSIT